jgi:hypothetical protein
MGGAKPAKTPAPASLPASDPNGPAAGPGFNSLLQGRHSGQEPGGSALPDKAGTEAKSARPARSLSWILLAADLLFIVLAIWLVFGRASRPSPWEVLLSVLALGLGAWLACYAFLMRR